MKYMKYMYVVFGFAETVFAGSERGQDHQVQAGFLSGRPHTGIVLDMTLVEGSAGTKCGLLNFTLISIIKFN